MFISKLDKTLFVAFLLLVISGVNSCVSVPESRDSQSAPSPTTAQSVPIYTFQIVHTYIHDREAFTEGLVYEGGILYEGTGLYGKSSLRKVDLETGKVKKKYDLPAEYFGEGIAIYEDKIIQLTWKEKTGQVYEKNSFKLLSRFSYPTEGWGITFDGKRLIMSDGSSTLYFLDPRTFDITGNIKVYEKNISIIHLNELEYINGKIYANIWLTNNIAIIDPVSGQVIGWIDLTGILPSQELTAPVDVLNGIAYDTANDRLFITGKLWPWLFEIKLVAKK